MRFLVPARSLLRLVLVAVVAFASASATANDRVTVLTTWFAQAEHGGLYQALATGIYKKHGLEVTIKMGGPQVNGLQLLAAGEADFAMNRDFAVLQGVERGIPLVTIAAPMQYDAQGIMTREDVSGLGDLKNKTILVASTAHLYWWPWLKKRYGYSDSQTRPYTGSLQPFYSDPGIVQQAMPSSEPFQAMKNGMKVKFHAFAAEGYPPYHGALVTLQKTIDDRPQVVARFVKASLEGWKSFLADPAPAAALIRKDNPSMSDEEIAFAVQKFKEMNIVTGGDAAQEGIGAMTDARWKRTAEFMVGAGLLKPATDWRKAYNLRFVREARVMP